MLIIWHMRRDRVIQKAAICIQRAMSRWYYQDVPALIADDADVFFHNIGTVHFNIVPHNHVLWAMHFPITEYIEDVD